MNSKEQTATAGAGALTGDVVKAVNDKGYLAGKFLAAVVSLEF